MEERISVKLFSDVGMGELFMSRLYHFQDHILNGLFGTQKIKEIQEAILRVVFDGLEPAFRSLRELRKEWSDEKIPEKKKRQHIENIYSYLTIAFKDRFQEVVKLMGYDIGFLFQNDKNFEAGCGQFLKSYPKIDPQFVEMIKNDRISWFNLMLNVRNNAIDHAAGKDSALLKQLEQNMTLEAVEKIFDNCWRAIEDFLAVFAVDKTELKYGHTILELSEYRQDKNYKHRFGWFIVEKNR